MVRAGLSRGHLCSVALELADEIGVDHLTMSALARRLGVAVPSLYEHVRGAPDLLDAAAAQAATELADVLGEALQGRAGRSALTAYAGALRQWATRHPGRYAASMRPPVGPSPSAGAARVAAGCAALLRGYGLDGSAATDAVRFVRSTLHGFISIETDGAFHHPRSLDGSWAACVEAVHRALSTWPS